jgi:hypothetical protein
VIPFKTWITVNKIGHWDIVILEMEKLRLREESLVQMLCAECYMGYMMASFDPRSALACCVAPPNASSPCTKCI